MPNIMSVPSVGYLYVEKQQLNNFLYYSYATAGGRAQLPTVVEKSIQFTPRPAGNAQK